MKLRPDLPLMKCQTGPETVRRSPRFRQGMTDPRSADMGGDHVKGGDETAGGVSGDRSATASLAVRFGMAVFLDHTILEVNDLAESVAFYRDVVGLESRGRSGPFEVMLITPDLALDLWEQSEPVSRHLAIGMDRVTFEATFDRIRASGTPYGDGPSTSTSMRGPGRSSGVHGVTDSVYFHDPSGHILEILTYDHDR
jgi:catechol 2,3-dioxygenase-like lactoylglutathione lyase family enzyme